MPVSRITTNFSLENEKAFIDSFHDCMQRVLKIPVYDRLVMLHQMNSGFFQPTDTSGNYFLFEISMFPGRSEETRKKLFRELVILSGQYGVDPLNVRTILNEIPRENWGIRGGVSGSDVELGFDVNV